MIVAPLNITCFEYRRRLEGGATRPLLVEAADESGNEYSIVLKPRHPDVRGGHFEGTSLACELICAILARASGLAVPNYFIVDVPEALPEAVPDEAVRRLLRSNIGPNFGLLYHEGVTTWQPEKATNSTEGLLQSMEDVLTFDATVINGDRKQNKPNVLWDGSQLLLIDHSNAVPVHLWDEETLLSSPLLPENEVRQHCTFGRLTGHNRQYKTIIESWQDCIEAEDFERIRSLIPDSWERNTGDLDKVFSFLQGRSSRFDDVSADLRRIVQ